MIFARSVPRSEAGGGMSTHGHLKMDLRDRDFARVS